MQNATKSFPSYTVMESATGGCLDTLAASFAQFRHLGGSEDVSNPLGKAKASLFEYITQAKCHGDMLDYPNWLRTIREAVHYYKSGTPCTDFAVLGSQKGATGPTGALFLAQMLLIQRIMPAIVRLEMVPGALLTNNGDEVREAVEQLEAMGYTVSYKVLDCWKYADPTARRRLFIVGLRSDVAAKTKWEWPKELCTVTAAPTARDIAQPDSEVHKRYWRTDNPAPLANAKTIPKAGRIQHIGYAGNPHKTKTAGHSTNPNSVQGWDGLWATMLPTNGGSRRPRLDWSRGDPIGDTRLATPVENCRGASLNEDSYISCVNKFHSQAELGMNQDQWVRELVNNGVPLSTGVAIDQQVSKTLIDAGISPTDPIAGAKDTVHACMSTVVASSWLCVYTR